MKIFRNSTMIHAHLYVISNALALPPIRALHKRNAQPTATCAHPGERPDANPWSTKPKKHRKGKR